MYSRFIRDLVVTYMASADKDRTMIRNAEFCARAGRPSMYWQYKISENLENALLSSGFVVDHYTTKEYIGCMAQYKRGEQ